MVIKKDLKMYSGNSLYLIFNKMNGYFEEINGNNYLTLVSEDKIKNHKELWIKIRDLIRSVSKKSEDYDEKYMRIKFNTDDKLPLNKTIKLPIITTVVRAVFHENNKYYPQVFLKNVCMECKWKIISFKKFVLKITAPIRYF